MCSSDLKEIAKEETASSRPFLSANARELRNYFARSIDLVDEIQGGFGIAFLIPGERLPNIRSRTFVVYD